MVHWAWLIVSAMIGGCIACFGMAFFIAASVYEKHDGGYEFGEDHRP